MYLRLTLQATLLLCCYFNNNEVSKFKPLTPTEYGKFSRWMHGNTMISSLTTTETTINSNLTKTGTTHQV